MSYPPLLKDKTSAEYRSFFEATYCRGPITTFDGIEVRFRKADFNHCFFDSVKTKDDTFSIARAERMLWIKAALEDQTSELYVGWNARNQKWDNHRRVAVVMGNYVVIIILRKNGKGANFCTAYLADTEPKKGQNFSTLQKIKLGPKWRKMQT